jgi:hypothetical protein
VFELCFSAGVDLHVLYVRCAMCVSAHAYTAAHVYVCVYVCVRACSWKYRWCLFCACVCMANSMTRVLNTACDACACAHACMHACASVLIVRAHKWRFRDCFLNAQKQIFTLLTRTFLHLGEKQLRASRTKKFWVRENRKFFKLSEVPWYTYAHT